MFLMLFIFTIFSTNLYFLDQYLVYQLETLFDYCQFACFFYSFGHIAWVVGVMWVPA